MPFCGKCGKQISENDAFCTFCGNKNLLFAGAAVSAPPGEEVKTDEPTVSDEPMPAPGPAAVDEPMPAPEPAAFDEPIPVPEPAPAEPDLPFPQPGTEEQLQPSCKGLSIAGLILSFLFPLVGLILSAVALSKVSKIKGRLSSDNAAAKAIAIAGTVVSVVFLAATAVCLFIFIDYILTTTAALFV